MFCHANTLAMISRASPKHRLQGVLSWRLCGAPQPRHVYGHAPNSSFTSGFPLWFCILSIGTIPSDVQATDFFFLEKVRVQIFLALPSIWSLSQPLNACWSVKTVGNNV